MSASALATLLGDNQAVEGPLKYTGIFRGLVAAIDDPERRGRVRVRVPQVNGQSTPTALLPWAERCFMDASSNAGDYQPLAENDAVFVMYEGGNAALPVVVGTWYGCPSGRSDLPREVQAPVGQHRRHIIKSRHGTRVEIGDESGDYEVKIAMPGGNVVHLRESNGGRGIHVTTAGGHSLSLQDEQPGVGGPNTANLYDQQPDRTHALIPAPGTDRDQFASSAARDLPVPGNKPADGVVRSNTPTTAKGFGQKGVSITTSGGHRIQLRDVTNPGFTAITADGHRIDIADGSDTIAVQTADGDTAIVMQQGGGITLQCPGTLTINAGQVAINTQSFDLNES